MLSSRARDLRELVAEFINWRVRRVQPEDRPGYAAAVVAKLFEFELGPIDSIDEKGLRGCSASELLDQVQDVFEDPNVREELLLDLLRLELYDMERSSRDLGYDDFGVLCDIFVAEACMPHRYLSSDDISILRDLLRSEQRRRENPVVK